MRLEATALRMPAEWEPHEATWLAWPHELTDWPGKFAPIPWAFAEIVRHLTRVERVFLLVESRDAEMRAKAILQKAGALLDAITFFYVPTDRGWMRDSGPIAVVEGAPSAVIPNCASASGVAITIVLWLAPLAASAPKAFDWTRAPAAL